MSGPHQQAFQKGKTPEYITDKFKHILKEYICPRTGTENLEIRRRCVYCDNAAASTCGRCQNARYCSRACQTKDWPQHKGMCRQFVDFTDDKRPSPAHVRGFLFPARESQAKHVWCSQTVDHTGTSICLDDALGPLDTDFWTYSVNVGLRQAGWPYPGHGLFLVCESRYARDGMPLNKSHAALAKPGHMRTYFGDLVVLAAKLDPSRPDNVVLDDVNFRDLRHTIDYFQTDRTNPCIANPERLPRGQAVPGLMIHCDGSEVRWAPYGLQSRIDKVLVLVDTNNQDEDVPVDLDPCPGARRVGLNWFVRRMPSSQDWAQGAVTPATLRNDMARYLVPQGTSHNEHRNRKNQVFVEDRDAFGQPHIGTVVIVEAGGGQVEAGHIEGLNAFLDSVARFQPFILQELADEQDLWLSRWEPVSLKDAKKAFQTFWGKWKEEQKAKGADVEHLLSPYEIKPTLSSRAVMVEALMNRIRRGLNIVDQIERQSE